MTESIGDQYEVLEKIGHGSFGIIRKVRRKTDGMILCRKEISYHKMSQKEREQLHSEFHILSTLRHPNIVGYYHREHLKQTQDLHLYMEYCGNGDLGRVIRDLIQRKEYADEQFVWEIFAQLVTALYRCHYGVNPPAIGPSVVEVINGGKVAKVPHGNMTILHRDLKPENIFLGEDNSVKLGDFGLSKMIQSHDFASTYVGTPFYMSPEICAAERYTLKSDIWSLGCIMYELCSREPPFNAKTHFQLVQKIKEGKVPGLPKVYSAELWSVIKSCLSVNPDIRPDTATLLNLPVVRLMRKEREAVELKKKLQTHNDLLTHRLKQLEGKLAGVEAEKAHFRQETDSQLRREWEVKARLEIDRLVNEEIEQLQRRFEAEVDARVQEELQKKRVSFGPIETQEFASSLSKSDFPRSFITSTDGEFPSITDITDYSVDSPEEPLKKSRILGRAQTMFERNVGTPMQMMDIDMASPSPMAIASLSLSPRRNNAKKAPTSNHPTIFDQIDDELSRTDFNPSDSEDDDTPIIPSPTRPPRSNRNPFGPQRPILTTTKTAPIGRPKTQNSLITNKAVTALSQPPPEFQLRAQPSNGALRERGNSPNRRLSKIPSVASLGTQGVEVALQRKPSLKKDPDQPLTKVAVKNNIKGRTLVELQQARAGGRPVEGVNVSPKRNPKDRLFSEPAVWDPEKDEMPSPFLVRRKQPTTRV
ncbi:kinase-like protein [Annulohypoxylon maeteangense]|uniref:kinase-like protein n=1 Tax=Annulohypoxylon maeteangense TaxID=1927788 RepID=UPI00200786B6|nr:kinase-like protein [Annulohypoxylon maeteangense]KAI0886151.1 kinase-like protein [Annulohypoxylon maeteangense]